ncbi:hypothetical protein ACFP3I_11365 [Chryseobacterium arachidis]|uniref:hypothetical protein n=1 Tax=Chryseobacterium arachidis TaxID=1416778 RepID=UPI003608F05F
MVRSISYILKEPSIEVLAERGPASLIIISSRPAKYLEFGVCSFPFKIHLILCLSNIVTRSFLFSGSHCPWQDSSCSPSKL